MNRKFWVIGNWKSNKTLAEAIGWCKEFSTLWKKQPINLQKVKVILCPAFIHLPLLSQFIKKSHIPLELGMQDVSPYPMGTYTGAISAQMVKELVTTVLIGHSERRQHFHETETELKEKINRANESGMIPIYCIQNEHMVIPDACEVVGYEPPWAISKGDPYATKAETAENANRAAKLIRHRAGRSVKIIYGGSTNPDNVAGYVRQSDLDGVLPGGASLSAATFYHLLQNVGQI